VAATGDPHLQNVHGERFDLMQPGRHVLINIPRGERADLALLRVVADAYRVGQGCGDIFFQSLNITGSWALARQRGGYTYAAADAANATPEWTAFGQVQLKVVHGRSQSGVVYLNFYVKHLGQAGRPVGGLLGDDDHTYEGTPPQTCLQTIRLQSVDVGAHAQESSTASIAVATLG